MELYHFLNVVYKRLWIIITLVVFGAVAGWYVAYSQPRLYQTSTTLLINPGTPNELIPYLTSFSSGNPFVAAESLAGSYSEYMRSRAFTSLVLDRLRLDTWPPALAASISTYLVPRTNFFKLTVTWRDPVEAQIIANGVVEVFLAENLRLQQEKAAAANVHIDELEKSLSYYETKVKPLRELRDKAEAAWLAGESDKFGQLTQLETRLGTNESVYTKLLSELQSARRSAQTALNTASVVDPAPPGWPVNQRTTEMVLMSIVIALAIGLAIAYALDQLDQTVKTPSDLEALVGQAPLGVISVIPESARFEKGGKDNRLITLSHPKAPASEAFRLVRTNIQFNTLDRPMRSLVVTSTFPGDGKTVVASNLAAIMAQGGKKVILVDMDLRRPSVHKHFGLSQGVGFTNLAVNSALEISRVVQPSGIDNLWIITSGPLPPNPAEFLGSHKVDEVLRRLHEEADMVVYDTPPMAPVTDAVVLSTKVDGTVLVVETGKTRIDVLQSAVSTLRKGGINLVGVILNKARPSHLGTYSYYYYDYYAQDLKDETVGVPGA